MPRNSFLTASAAVAMLALLAASAVLAAPATEGGETLQDEDTVEVTEPSEVGLGETTTDSDGKENETSCIEFFGRRNCNRRQVLPPTAAGQGRDGETAHENNTATGKEASHAGLDEYSNQMTQIQLGDQLPLPQQKRQFLEVLEAACQVPEPPRVSFLRYAYRLYKLGATLERAMLQHGTAAPLTPAPAPAHTARLSPDALAYYKYRESLRDACRDLEHVKNLGDVGLLGQVQQLSNDAVALLQFVPAYRGSVPPAPTPKTDAELAAEKAADLLKQQKHQFIETLQAACHDYASLNASFLRHAQRLAKQSAALEAILEHGADTPLTPTAAPIPPPMPHWRQLSVQRRYNMHIKDACRAPKAIKYFDDDSLLRLVKVFALHGAAVVEDAVAQAALQFGAATAPVPTPMSTPTPAPRPKTAAERVAELVKLQEKLAGLGQREKYLQDMIGTLTEAGRDVESFGSLARDSEQVAKDRAALEQAIQDLQHAAGAAQAPAPTADVAAAQASELATLRQELAQLRRREERFNETTRAVKAVAEQDLGAAIVGLKAAAEKIAKALATVGQQDGADAAPSPTTTAAPATTPKTAEEKAADLRKLEQQLLGVLDREETLNEVIEQLTDAGRDIDSVQLYAQYRKELVKERAALEEAIAVLQHAPTTTPRPTPAPRRKTAAEKAAELVELQRRLAEVRRGEQEARDSMKRAEDRGDVDHLGGYVRTGLRLAEERVALELDIATLQFSAADEQPQQAALREAVQTVKAVAEQDLGGAILGLQAAAEKIAKALAAMGQPQPSR